MKPWVVFTSLLLPSSALGQVINVERNTFPGVKTLIVESRSGYRGEYELDATGRTQVEKRYKKRQHLETSRYSFTRNGREAAQVIVFDINNPGKEHTIYRRYNFSPDSSRTLAEVCYTDTDTLYTVRYTSFNDRNQPLNYRKTVYGGGKHVSDIALLYQEANLIRWTSTDQATGQLTTCDYTYNAQGDVTSEKRSESPKAAATMWVDGQGDFMQWRYVYDSGGRWLKKYQFIGERAVLVESRKYVK